MAAELLTLIDSVAWQGPPVVDLFAGSHAVSATMARHRLVIANDVEGWSAAIGDALLGLRTAWPSRQQAEAELREPFEENWAALTRGLRPVLAREANLLSDDDWKAFRAFSLGLPQVARAVESSNGSTALSRLVRSATDATPRGPFRLFACYYAGTYFSLRQACEIDSLRYAVEQVRPRPRRVRYIASLLYALSACVNSPGHFAQYLRPHSEKAYGRMREAMRLSIWDRVLSTVQVLADWWAPPTPGCQVLQRDYGRALSLLARDQRQQVAAVYADPPYTADQYSRFYHILDTCLRYDYPKLTGAGLYRLGRHSSPFSCKRTARGAFRVLAERSASLGSPLVISYIDDGLVPIDCIAAECRGHYRDVSVVVLDGEFNHSNQGRRGELCQRRKPRRAEVAVVCQRPILSVPRG